MLTLKELISSHINDLFIDIEKNEKKLLGNLIFKKLLDSPFHKDNYYTSAVVLDGKEESYISINRYHISSGKNDTLYSYDNDYAISSGFSSVKQILLSTPVISRINNFINILENHSSTLDEYTDKLIEAQKGDKEFFNTIESFKYIFDEEKLIFPNDVDYLLVKKGMDSIESSICKNNKYFTGARSHDLYILYSKKTDSEIKDIYEENWKKKNNERQDYVNYLKERAIDINIYYEQHSNNIDKVIDNIRIERPYLFEKPSLDEIEFSFFETKKIDEESDLTVVLETERSISDELLEKYNISLSKAYEISNRKYKKHVGFEKDFYDLFCKRYNDLSQEIEPIFYGMDFINKEIFYQNKQNNSYIVAKHNNETIGFISFSSSKYDSDSLIKNIEYVCIKENFRGIGLAELFYDKLMGLMNDTGHILQNVCYSEQGGKKLPKLKDKISKKYPDLVLLSHAHGNLSYLGEEKALVQRFKNETNYRLSMMISEYEEDFYHNIKQKSEDIVSLFKKVNHEIDQSPLIFIKSDNDFDHLNKQTELVQKYVNLMENIIMTPVIENKKKIAM